jgi:hypothetical protein
MQIADLWESSDPKAWDDALERYWDFVQPRNLDLERALDALNLERIRWMDAQQWFDFLKDEYFRWKYTAPNRYASTTRHLQRYVENNTLGDLDQIRGRLLTLDTADIEAGLEAARSIRGLGTAGASGLLALMYPQTFGTVDQFAVKALRLVNRLPEAVSLARMNPENLYTRDGVVIIGILRRKAAENNRVFKLDIWSPRKLDKVLWTYGR